MNICRQGVEDTNDNATQSKRCAVNLGYWKDQFIHHFFPHRLPIYFDRKTPEINRGYYARVQAFDYLLNQFFNFIDKINEKNIALNSKLLKCQIINIGCGFDTLYWRLNVNKKIDCIYKFVDLDLESVTCKKVHSIKSKKELLNVLGSDIKLNLFELHSNKYHLVAVDLRNVVDLNRSLFQECKLDSTLPTFIISECVLVYISKNDVSSLLKWFTSKFDHCILTNYEQVNLFDRFGEIMLDNFKLRNCEIKDLESCRSLETQKQKFLDNGFTNVDCWTMEKIYKTYLDQLDRERIEKIEFLDEINLLDQLLSHYCISLSRKGLTKLLDEEYEFGFI